MDPLSLTASIITLLGAGGAVGKGIRKLIALRHAPKTLLLLEDEILYMQQVVTLSQDLFRQHLETIEANKGLSFVLSSALKRTTVAIQDL